MILSKADSDGLINMYMTEGNGPHKKGQWFRLDPVRANKYNSMGIASPRKPRAQAREQKEVRKSG